MKKVDLPWFPLFPRDFLSDPRVQLLDNAELGSYFRLLCCEWIQGPLPSDAESLSRLSQTGEKWSAVSEKVLRFFCAKKNGTLINRKLERIRREQLKLHKSRSDSGKRGAQKRWGGHSQANSPPYSNQNQNQNQNNQEEIYKPHPTPPQREGQRKVSEGKVSEMLARYWDDGIPEDDRGWILEVYDFITKNPATGKPLSLAKRYEIVERMGKEPWEKLASPHYS